MNTKTSNILIVDDDELALNLLRDILEYEGYKIFSAQNGNEAIDILREYKTDLVLLDINMPDPDGYEVCKLIKQDPRTSGIPVLFVSGMHDLPDKFKAFSCGGLDYITKPFEPLEILVRVKNHITLNQLHKKLLNTNNILEERVRLRTQDLKIINEQLKKEINERTDTEIELKKALSELKAIKENLEEQNLYFQEEIKLEHNFEEIIGSSRSLQKIFRQIEQISKANSTVLITGETGTGKELVARAIHNLSPRRSEPFIKVNCAALPGNLIESELFGHEKGAFTGAIKSRKGRFEIAHRGTIFLDEIGELPLDIQVKLLRVLQEGEFERVGGEQTINTDVRVISATNRNLEKMVKENIFREDLFFRLNVLPIIVPPLRERKEDLKDLTRFFVTKYSKKLGKNFNNISSRSIEILHLHSWPGNVRELENIIERAVIFSKEPVLVIDPSMLQRSNFKNELKEPVTLEEIERQHICKILSQVNWVIHGKYGAAALLNINPSTLRSRMKKLKINRPVLSEK